MEHLPNHLQYFVVILIAYFVIGLVLSSLMRSRLSLPWYLTHTQYCKFMSCGFALIVGFVCVRLSEIYLVLHAVLPDFLMILPKACAFFLGFGLPLHLYRQQQLKSLEYVKILKEKNNCVKESNDR